MPCTAGPWGYFRTPARQSFIPQGASSRNLRDEEVLAVLDGWWGLGEWCGEAERWEGAEGASLTCCGDPPKSFSTGVLWCALERWLLQPYKETGKNNNHASQHFLSTYYVPVALRCLSINLIFTELLVSYCCYNKFPHKPFSGLTQHRFIIFQFWSSEVQTARCWQGSLPFKAKREVISLPCPAFEGPFLHLERTLFQLLLLSCRLTLLPSSYKDPWIFSLS